LNSKTRFFGAGTTSIASSRHIHWCAVALLFSCSVHAAGTLEKIAQSGAITLGYRDSSPPFSYLDDNKRPIGYSVDICLKVVDAIKRELKRPDLVVKYTPVSSASRITTLVAYEIDIECGSTTSTAERRKQVAFTIPTFIAATRLMVREGSGIKSFNDLAGKTVVTTKGTSSEKFFGDRNTALTLRANLTLAKDHAESFSLLEAGKADAFIMDDVLLFSLRAAAKEPAKFEITNDPLTIEPLSIMMRKDDPAFKKLVDAEVTRVIMQGEITPMYRKWFESPIPPQKLNLKLPMSYMLRDSFKSPTDWLPD
jgi:ABC-type amino acid transport substrate-binding protein